MPEAVRRQAWGDRQPACVGPPSGVTASYRQPRPRVRNHRHRPRWHRRFRRVPARRCRLKQPRGEPVALPVCRPGCHHGAAHVTQRIHGLPDRFAHPAVQAVGMVEEVRHCAYRNASVLGNVLGLRRRLVLRAVGRKSGMKMLRTESSLGGHRSSSPVSNSYSCHRTRTAVGWTYSRSRPTSSPQRMPLKPLSTSATNSSSRPDNKSRSFRDEQYPEGYRYLLLLPRPWIRPARLPLPLRREAAFVDRPGSSEASARVACKTLRHNRMLASA